MRNAIVFVSLIAGATGCGGAASEGAQSEEGSEDVGESVAAATQPGIGPLRTSPNYYKCADEHGFCAAGFAYVAFGARGKYFFTQALGGVACEAASFGGDPIKDVVKACYFTNYVAVVSEHQQYTVDGPARDIAYGSDGRFRYRSLSGTFTCDTPTFGNVDPNENVVKQCFVPLPLYAVDVAEEGTMTGLNDTPIAYGANGKYVFKVASGSHACTNEAFGRDPIVDVPKHCHRVQAVRIGTQGQTVTSDAALTVYLSGLNGNYSVNTTGGSFLCSKESFTGDPDIETGHAEACYRMAF